MNNRINKILLIWPSFVTGKEKTIMFPLGALSIGTYLKKRNPNFDICILDAQLNSDNDILKKIDLFNPDIVGISISHIFYNNTLPFARKAKSIGARVILGGAYASSLREEILKNRGIYSNDYCVDAIIQSDGEKSFYEYIIGKPLDKINNLVYQDDGLIKENSIEYLDLNKLSSFDMSLINPEDYFEKQQIRIKNIPVQKRIFNVYGHKGCYWREKTGGCIFCCNLHRNVRAKDPRIFANEIIELISKYNINGIEIVDEDFLGNIQWFEEFYKLYQDCIKRRYTSIVKPPFLMIYVRIDRINLKVVKMLRKINVSKVFIGIESADQKCLLSMNKGIISTSIKQSIELLNKYQIGMICGFIIGSPGETRNGLKKTLDLIKEISLLDYVTNVRFREFTPLIGSSSWEMFLKKNNSKYKYNDLIDWSVVIKSWRNLFCDLSQQDINWFKNELIMISKQRKKVRFFLFNKFI